MRFFLGHPTYPQYGFYLLSAKPALEQKLERLGPVRLVAKSFDAPPRNTNYREWTDRLNSLCWPQGGDCFSTLVVLIDDAQNDLLASSIDTQRTAYDATTTWRWPYLVLSARLSPPEGEYTDGVNGVKFQYAGESYPNAGLPPVNVETPFLEWKLYPLEPVNLTSLTADEQYRGLWLLPLVDIRYFMRNVPLNQFPTSSSSSGSGTDGLNKFPYITVQRDDVPGWFPPILGFPNDTTTPSNYQPLAGIGTHPNISGATRWGEAVELQAELMNLRIVCRDVRSMYNVPIGGFPHKDFGGVVADCPEDWSNPFIDSYHIEACNKVQDFQSRVAGGDCDARTLDDLIARKLQFLFRVRGTETFYNIVIATKVDYPVTTFDLKEDTDGPDPTEAKIIPAVFMGLESSTRYPGVAERSTMLTEAMSWALFYYAWRHRQAYVRLPAVHPLIPNGHAQMVRWDFQKGSFFTTYIALEGVQGSLTRYSARREPFYARIDGEGSLQDSLHGFYAYTELLDVGGNLTTHPNPRIGYVLNVNGQSITFNPARDESGKVAVPVGLPVYIRPGVPYIDATTGKIFDHYLFTTTDLVQIVRLKPTLEVNSRGHIGIIINRWSPELNGFVDSRDAWGVLLK